MKIETVEVPTQSYERWYDEGRQARNNGITKNPYSNNRLPHDAWAEGFND